LQVSKETIVISNDTPIVIKSFEIPEVSEVSEVSDVSEKVSETSEKLTLVRYVYLKLNKKVLNNNTFLIIGFLIDSLKFLLLKIYSIIILCNLRKSHSKIIPICFFFLYFLESFC